MERSDDRALEQRERRFHGVGVNVSSDVLADGVIHALMPRVLALKATVLRRVIGVDVRCFGMHVGADEFVEFLPRPMLARGLPHADLTVALDSGEDHRVAVTVASAESATVPDVRLIHFYCASKRSRIQFSHRRSNAVAEVPRSLVAD